MGQEDRRGLTGNPQDFYTDSMAEGVESSGGARPRVILRRPDGQSVPLPPRNTPPEVVAERTQAQLQYEQMMRQAAEAPSVAEEQPRAPENGDILRLVLQEMREQRDEQSELFRALLERDRQRDEELREIREGRHPGRSGERAPEREERGGVESTEVLQQALVEGDLRQVNLEELEEQVPGFNEERVREVLKEKRNPYTEITRVYDAIDGNFNGETEELSDEEKQKRQELAAQRLGYYVDNILRSVQRRRLKLKPETLQALQDYQNALDDEVSYTELQPLLIAIKEGVDVRKFYENATFRRSHGLPQCDEEFLDILARSNVINPDAYQLEGERPLYTLGRTTELNIGNYAAFYTDMLRLLYEDNPFAELNFTSELGIHPEDARSEIHYGSFPRQASFFSRRQWDVIGDETESDTFVANEYSAGKHDELYDQTQYNFWFKMYPAQVNHSRRLKASTADSPEAIAQVYNNVMTQGETPRWLFLARWPLSNKEEMERFVKNEGVGTLGVMFKRGWFSLYHSAFFGYNDDSHQVSYPLDEQKREINLFLKGLGDYDPARRDTLQTGKGVDTFYLSLVGRMLSLSDDVKKEFSHILIEHLTNALPLSNPEKLTILDEWENLEDAGSDINLFTPASINAVAQRVPSLRRLVRHNEGEIPLSEDQQMTVISDAAIQLFSSLSQKHVAAPGESLSKDIAQQQERVRDATYCYIYGFQKGFLPRGVDIDQILAKYRQGRPPLVTEEDRREFAKEIFAANMGRAVGQNRDTYNIFKVGRDDKIKRHFVKAHTDGIIAAERAEGIDPSEKVVLENLVYDAIWWSGPAEVAEYEAVNRGKNRYAKVFRSRVADRRGVVVMPTAHGGIKSIYPGYEYNVTFTDVNTGAFMTLMDVIQGAEGTRFDPHAETPLLRCKDVIETDFATVTGAAGKELDFITKTADLDFDKLYDAETQSIDFKVAGQFFGELYGAVRSILSTYSDTRIFGKEQVRIEYGKKGGQARVEFINGTVENRLLNDEILFLNSLLKNYYLSATCYYILKWVEAHTTVAGQIGYERWKDARTAASSIKKGLQSLKIDLEEQTTEYGTEVSIPSKRLIPDEVIDLIVNPDRFGVKYQQWKKERGTKKS